MNQKKFSALVIFASVAALTFMIFNQYNHFKANREAFLVMEETHKDILAARQRRSTSELAAIEDEKTESGIPSEPDVSPTPTLPVIRPKSPASKNPIRIAHKSRMVVTEKSEPSIPAPAPREEHPVTLKQTAETLQELNSAKDALQSLF